MTSFYQPHVREPVFLALTHAGLWALDDQDYGVSLASLVGSTLAIFATYLVGAALLSPLTGLLAALLTAIEFEMIAWAPDGWRDDTFTATILFAAWALLRLRARPSFGNALLAGGLAPCRASPASRPSPSSPRRSCGSSSSARRPRASSARKPWPRRHSS